MKKEQNYRVSGIDYLHEKIEESRHNETLSYLMFTAGTIFFVGGIVETMMISENPDWLLFFPYKITPHVSSFLGLFLEFVGFTLLVLGIVLSVYYMLEKSLYLNQIKGAYVQERNSEAKRQKISQKLANPHDKQHENKNVTELDDCIKYLIDERGFDKSSAEFYCKVLGSRWQELITEEES